MKGKIKTVDRLNQSHTPRLEYIIRIDVFCPKTFDKRQDKPHIADNKSVARILVPLFQTPHQLLILLMGKLRKPCGIQSADTNLLQHTHLLTRKTAYVWRVFSSMDIKEKIIPLCKS